MRVEVKAFTGLDRRRLTETTDDNGVLRMVLANNVELNIGGGIRVRPQLKLKAQVDPDSLGLYSLGGKLRCAYAQQDAVVPRPPDGFEYDVFCDGNSGIDGVVNGTAVEVANVTAWEGKPYLVIGRETDPVPTGSIKYEHHYIQTTMVPLPVAVDVAGPSATTTTMTVYGPIPALVTVGSTLVFTSILDSADYLITDITGQVITIDGPSPLSGDQIINVRPNGKTKVPLPFAPGRALMLAAEKVWADNIDTNNIHFSSSINGPTDWTNPGDAGYLGTAANVSGNQGVNGLGIFNGKLTVFYSKDLQVWTIGADPVSHRMDGSVGGAGTDFPRSIANCMGDVFYFSQGGVRSVQAVVVTGQLKEDDIGAPIRYWTNSLDPLVDTMISTWSPARQQHLIFVDTTVYALTLSPNSKTSGWSKWTIPWAISDIAEQNGILYVRRANTGEIYEFSEQYVGEAGFTWSVRFPHIDASTFNIKKWQNLYAAQSGTATWSFITEPRNESATAIPIGTISGSFDSLGNIPIGVCSHHLGLQASGTSAWELDGFTVDCEVGNQV